MNKNFQIAAKYLDAWDWNVYTSRCTKCQHETTGEFCRYCGGKVRKDKQMPIELEIAFLLAQGKKLKKCKECKQYLDPQSKECLHGCDLYGD